MRGRPAKKLLECDGRAALSTPSPNFARACGRVLVGGHPDKRPDSRPGQDRDQRGGNPTGDDPGRDRRVPNPDQQPEAKPANPALHRGRDLKQRRSGLFWSRLGPPKAESPKRLVHLARRAERVLSRSNPRQLHPGDLTRRRRLHRAASWDRRPWLTHRTRCARVHRPWGDRAMTERIREFLRYATRGRPLPRRSTSTSCATTIIAFARALPDTRVFYAVKANPAPEVLRLLASARLVLRHRLGGRDRDGARGRRDGRPHLLRQHDQEGARHRARLRARRAPLRRRLRGRGREDRPRPRPARSVFCRILCDGAGAEWPLSRKFGCVPEMATDVLEHAHRLGLRGLWRLVPCRLAAAQHGTPGTRRWPRPPRSSGSAPSAASSLSMVNLGGGFPTKYLKADPGRRELRRVDLPGAVEALRQPPARDDHRAGPRHGRQCRHHRGRGRARSRRSRTRTRCAGSISTSASSAVSPRRWTRRSATPSAPTRDGDETAPCVLAGPTCDSARRDVREGAVHAAR